MRPLIALLIGLMTLSSASLAQERQPSGPVLGPMMMGLRGFGMLCSPQAIGFGEWQLSRVEKSVKPAKEQSEKLSELRTASAKATDKIKTACPREIPRTAPERMALMEKRVEAMLDAVKIVRPAFENFYASLTPEQRKKVDSAPTRRWNWRFWQRN